MKINTVNYIIVLLAALVLTNCSEPEKESTSPSTYELLQGDWVTEKFEHGFLLRHFHINIEDSIFTLFSEYSDSVRFSLKDDQITVFDSTDIQHLGRHQKYQISILNQEELVLIAKSSKVKKRLKDYSWNSNTLTFHRVQRKNNLDPIRISFSSSGCYGFCPSMKLEIDNKFNIRFFGSIYSDLEGGHVGKIDKKIYNSLIRQVQNLPLDSLKAVYTAPWTDDQTTYLVIETKDTIIRTKAYGVFMQPVELTILMDNLIYVPKRLDLRKNKNIDDKKSFDPFLKISYPIPPPPFKEE